MGQRLQRLEECEIHARRLQTEFEHGDMIAPFECCHIWEMAEVPRSTLPTWVSDHLFRLSATYFESGPFALPDYFAEPDMHGTTAIPAGTTPRDYLTLAARQRDKIRPSLDDLAGLHGCNGNRFDAWIWRIKHNHAAYAAAFLDDLETRAIRAREREKQATAKGEPPPADNECDKLYQPTPDPKDAILILDRLQGRLTEAIQAEISRLFKLSGEGDHAKVTSKAKTMRRRRRQARHTDN